MTIRKRLEAYFEFSKHGTTWWVEIVAGLSTFFSISYIVFVNPSILSAGGVPSETALFATIVASALSTAAMAIFARNPFVLAPGLEMSAYFAFFLIPLGFSWQEGLGAVFWSGVIFLVLSVTKLRSALLNAFPENLKVGITGAVGAFIAVIGLKLAGIVSYGDFAVNAIGNPFSQNGLLLLIGFGIAAILGAYRLKSAILFSIVGTSAIALLLQVHDTVPTHPGNVLDGARSGFLAFDPLVILQPRSWGPIFILFVVDFYGSVAKLIGLSRSTSILDDQRQLPRMQSALLVDSFAAMFGSALGTTSVTTFVESGVGIRAGGRTGVVGLVCAILLLCCLFATQVIALVPVIATAGSMLYIGLLVIRDSFPKKDSVSRGLFFLMTMTIFITFSLDKAILIGILGAILIGILRQNTEKRAVALWISAALLITANIFAALSRT